MSRGTRPLEATLGSYSIVNGEYKQKKARLLSLQGRPLFTDSRVLVRWTAGSWQRHEAVVRCVFWGFGYLAPVWTVLGSWVSNQNWSPAFQEGALYRAGLSDQPSLAWTLLLLEAVPPPKLLAPEPRYLLFDSR